MRVMKFGGTSVGDPARIANVCDLVAAKRREHAVLVVVSAASRVTDMLLHAASQAARGHVEIEPLAERVHALADACGIARERIDGQITTLQQTLVAVGLAGTLSAEHADLVASFGERISVRTIAAALDARGIAADAYDAFDVGMVTDEVFGGAEPLPASEQAIRTALGGISDRVAVVTGFIGRTTDGRVTTLGRGGSDYSAAIFGAALDADEIEIWTDVDGVMSADPRVVPEARTVPALSFTEAAELAYFGAKVLHPKTILPAIRKSIPVRVLNTFRPAHAGTVITAEGGTVDPQHPAQAIAAKKGITIVQVVSSRMLLAHGFLERIFDGFAKRRIVVDLVATSEVSVSLTVDREDGLADVAAELASIADVQLLKGRALVAVVGRGIGDATGIAGRIFGATARAEVNVELISAGSGRVNISMVVPEPSCDATVHALHRELFGAA